MLEDAGDANHVGVLERLLAIEVDATETRRHESRRRLAGLPADRRIDDFDHDAQPPVTPGLLRDLATLRFIDKGGNCCPSARPLSARPCAGLPGPGSGHRSPTAGRLLRVPITVDTAEVSGLATTIYRWQDEVLAFFDTRASNAATEAANMKIKSILPAAWPALNRM